MGVFILMSGRSPFDAESVAKIYKNIVRGFKKDTFPKSFTVHLVDVISSLCRKKPEERLPMGPRGLWHLEAHTWYSGFDWEQMRNRSLAPPHVPRVCTTEDVA